MYLCYCVILCVLVTSTQATRHDSASTDEHIDGATMHFFLTELFGEMWGYYLGWIFSVPPTLVVLPAKEKFCAAKMGPRTQNESHKNGALLVKQKQTTDSSHQHTHQRASREEISVNKFIAMIVCFGIFGIMATLPEWKGADKHGMRAPNADCSSEYNSSETLKDRSSSKLPNIASSPDSHSAPDNHEQLTDGVVQFDKDFLISLEKNALTLTFKIRPDNNTKSVGDTDLTLNHPFLYNIQKIAPKLHSGKITYTINLEGKRSTVDPKSVDV